MYRTNVRSLWVVLAASVAVGTAACSSGSTLPGISQQSLATLEKSHAGHFARIGHQPPVGMVMEWLLTDGSVLAQSNSWTTWYRYVPDAKGNYSDGTWSQVASLQSPYGPLYMAADVLADGRFAISGGEYNTPGNGYDLQLTNLGAVYDPVKNTWTPIGHPAGWNNIGDSPSSVLPNGKLLVGDKLITADATLDPKTLAWTVVGDSGKSDFNAEEGWTLLPNGTVLTADVKNAPNSEIYNPATGTWTSAGSTIVDLHSPSPYGCLMYGPSECYYPPGEIGPAILRPDGTVFYTGSYTKTGGAGHTAIYSTVSGKWTVGPDFPNGDNAGDSFATLEPSGNVLVFGVSGQVYEWNGSTLSAINGLAYGGPPLLLPTGQVMVLSYSSVSLYTPTGQPQAKWLPTIKRVPTTLTRGQTYRISGRRFNGFGQAMSYGDENQNATNYPLVRITNKATGNVFYARTHNHSTMGVATGALLVSTHFDVPPTMDTGASSLVVVANGIASKPVTVTIK